MVRIIFSLVQNGNFSYRLNFDPRNAVLWITQAVCIKPLKTQWIGFVIKEQVRKGFRPISASQISLGSKTIFREFFEIFWELFGNYLEILSKFYGNSLGVLVNSIIILLNSLGIPREFLGNSLEFLGNSIRFFLDIWLGSSECLGDNFK